MSPAAKTSIYQRIVAILEELPAIGKDQRNEQQGFMFRGHDDILNALNPLLAKHGVFVVPDVLERITDQRATARGGVMYEVNLHVGFVFYGADGDSFQASTWGEGTDSGDKATNKAMTMAFKNVLNQTFAISSAEFKDSDSTVDEETTGRESAKPARQPSAAEKDIQGGTARMIGTNIQILDQAFPEAPGEDAGRKRTWQDTTKAYLRDRFQKQSVAELTEAEGVQVNEWLEGQYRDLEANKDIPFEGQATDDERAAADEAAAAAEAEPDPEVEKIADETFKAPDPEADTKEE